MYDQPECDRGVADRSPRQSRALGRGSFGQFQERGPRWIVILSEPRSTGATPLITGAGPSTRGAQAARTPPRITAQSATPPQLRVPMQVFIFPRTPPDAHEPR